MFTLCTKLKKSNNSHSATQQGEGGYAASLALTLTLLFTPIETVCQSNRAPSQTSPRVECWCTFSTMLHCSLHIACLPRRGIGFNKETMGVRWSPLLKRMPRILYCWGELLCDARTRLWRGEKFPITVFCLQRGLNGIYAQCRHLRLQIWNLPKGGLTHLCHFRIISSHNTCFAAILHLEREDEISTEHVRCIRDPTQRVNSRRPVWGGDLFMFVSEQ